MKEYKEEKFQKIYLALLIMYTIGMPLITLVPANTRVIDVETLCLVIRYYTLTISIVSSVIIILNRNALKISSLKNKKLIILFLLFLVWCIITSFTSTNKLIAFTGSIYRSAGLIEYLSCISFALLGFLLNEDNLKKYFKVLVTTSIIIATLQIFDEYIPFYQMALDQYTGFYFNINHYAYYLTYTIVANIYLFLDEKDLLKKSLLFLGYIIQTYVLIKNNTFGCYLTIFIFLILLSIQLIKKKQSIILMGILTPFIILSMLITDHGTHIVMNNVQELLYDINIISRANESSYPIDDYRNEVHSVGNARGMLWIKGIIYIKDKPIFGYGLDNTAKRYYDDHIYIDTAHNIIIHHATATGIPGMLFYIIPLFIIGFNGIKKMNKNSYITNLIYFIVITHIILSMFSVTMYSTIIYYVIALGMVLRKECLEETI